MKKSVCKFLIFTVVAACTFLLSSVIIFAAGPTSLYLDFENQQLIDKSGNNHTLASGGTNTPAFSTGKIGNGISFDGTNYVKVSNSSLLNCQTDEELTLSLWVKTTNQNCAVLNKFNPTTDSYWSEGYAISLVNGVPHFYLQRLHTAKLDFYDTKSTAKKVNDGQWHFIAITIVNKPTTLVNIYVDGFVVEKCSIFSVPSGILWGSSTEMFLGSDQFGGQKMTGMIDDVKVLRYNPTDSKINKMFQADGANLYMNFSNHSYTDSATSDLSGNNNNGVLAGSPLPVISGGQRDTGMSFSTGGYISIPDKDSLDFGVGDLSIVCSIKTTEQYTTILNKRDSNQIGYLLHLYNGVPLFQLNDPQNNAYNYYDTTSAKINDGNWHTIAVSVDRDSTTGVKIYVDGKFIKAFNATYRTGNISNNGNLSIGYGSYYYKGSIDEVYLFNRAISQDEVTKLNSYSKFYGHLSVINSRLSQTYSETPVQLKGMSSHGLNWPHLAAYTNYNSMKYIRDAWGANLVRAAMYTGYYDPDWGQHGYFWDPGLKEKVKTLVEAAINLDMYILIDFHTLHDGNPLGTHTVNGVEYSNLDTAKEFFREMAALYGKYPNVIFEIDNEPNLDNANLPGVSNESFWNNYLKPYTEAITAVIRSYSNNIITTGSPCYTQAIDIAEENRVSDPNTMYSFHFYTYDGHNGSLPPRLISCAEKGLPIFVTESGATDPWGMNNVKPEDFEMWMNLMNRYGISWTNWAMSYDQYYIRPDTGEQPRYNALTSTASINGNWTDANLTPSGKQARNYIKNTPSNGPFLYPVASLGSDKKVAAPSMAFNKVYYNGQITRGQILKQGDSIYSNNRNFRLVMQEDGNLVIYNNNTGTALWCASGTWSNGKKLDFLNNGNLVCYKADGTICFSTNTADRNAHYLKMQDDGNLVIYDTTGTPLWATGTFG